MIHFKEPGPQFIIQDYVKPKQLVTKIRFFRLRASIVMLKLRLYSDDCLYYYILYLQPNLLRLLSECSLHTRTAESASEAFRESELMFIAIEVLILFVQRVVSQMSVHVLNILIYFVLLTRQSHQTIFKHEYRQRIDDACDEYINSEVKLMPINQCRVFHVFLNYKSVLLLYNLRSFHLILTLSIWGSTLSILHLLAWCYNLRLILIDWEVKKINVVDSISLIQECRVSCWRLFLRIHERCIIILLCLEVFLVLL